MASGTVEGELWGARAEEWAALAERTTEPLWHRLLAGVEVGRGTNHVDLGCGAGGLCMVSAALGATVSGFDASANLLDIARRRVPAGDFRQGDLEALPYLDGEFDAITAVNSMQFVDDQPQALREAKRVLRPGGKFGIGMWCEPERCEMSVVFKALGPLMPPPTGNEPPSLTLRENLITVVEAGGFSVRAEGEVECPFSFASPEEAWRGFGAAGIIVAVARSVGEEAVKDAVLAALEPLKRPDGSLCLINWFRYLICS